MGSLYWHASPARAIRLRKPRTTAAFRHTLCFPSSATAALQINTTLMRSRIVLVIGKRIGTGGEMDRSAPRQGLHKPESEESELWEQEPLVDPAL